MLLGTFVRLCPELFLLGMCAGTRLASFVVRCLLVLQQLSDYLGGDDAHDFMKKQFVEL